MGLGVDCRNHLRAVFCPMEKVTATRKAWSAEAEAGLVVSMWDDHQIIKRLVETNRAECWLFEGAGIDCWSVVRRDGETLFLMCIEGTGARQVVPLIERAAKRAGCTKIRAHIKRRGLSRMFPDWELKEYVHEKEI